MALGKHAVRGLGVAALDVRHNGNGVIAPEFIVRSFLDNFPVDAGIPDCGQEFGSGITELAEQLPELDAFRHFRMSVHPIKAGEADRELLLCGCHVILHSPSVLLQQIAGYPPNRSRMTVVPLKVVVRGPGSPH